LQTLFPVVNKEYKTSFLKEIFEDNRKNGTIRYMSAETFGVRWIFFEDSDPE
jgi:hypothetical protein